MTSFALYFPTRLPLCTAVTLLAIVTPSLARLAAGETLRLEGAGLSVDVDSQTGGWFLIDRSSGVRWPSRGRASAGAARGLGRGFNKAEVGPNRIRLHAEVAAVVFELDDQGQSLQIRYEGDGLGEVKVLGDALTIQAGENGHLLIPCREGLLVSADSGKTFRRTFGASDYEGCHMNMLGCLKSGAAMLVTWDDYYVSPEVASALAGEGSHGKRKQRLSATFRLRQSARKLTLTPLGKGDWNTIAAGYRRIAARKGFVSTVREKIRRDPHAELLLGAANVKLWTCLARRMNEESTREESVTVRWTFDEAARIAEHLHKDLGLRRCLFILGGWTAGGYDCRHPDNLPANEVCGGNRALADALQRIQKLGFVACLHDNYQDMYRDAPSWNPAFIEKKPDGTLVKGGRWLGGRAYMVCASKQLDLARRPQNLPAIRKLFPAWSYFIDTTFAVGPRECHDRSHPTGRNDDVAWKIRLSDYARGVFGLFGSECGREWALPHSDFFEGLVGVSGRFFHNLDLEVLGASSIPFWEMVYHDCQVCYGKYGYAASSAADYVAHHVLCARPLHYHSFPDHLYWSGNAAGRRSPIRLRPRIVSIEPAGRPRALRIRYRWQIEEDISRDWRVFVHFSSGTKIRFQDDHAPEPETSQWRNGQSIEIGPRTVSIPESVREKVLDIYMGLFQPRANHPRARLDRSDDQHRVLVGRLHLLPQIRFERMAEASTPDRACYLRSDGGWAQGMHPLDVFIKNTHEVLGPLNRITAHDVLTRLDFLTPDGAVRRAVYGAGKTATTVIVNFGQSDAEVSSRLGGIVLLPPWGFVVDGRSFAAFYAKRWRQQAYVDGALFTLRALDDRPLMESRRVRIFHGFGGTTVRWAGRFITVERERIVGAVP